MTPGPAFASTPDRLAPAASRAPATRVTVVLTHPIQYYSPWFRHISDKRADLELSVVYATVPSDEQQGVENSWRSRTIRASW